jgi:hypothetical protein
MSQLPVVERLVDPLEDRLDRPVHPAYPLRDKELRDKEIVGIWRKRSVEALHALGARGFLLKNDSFGRPLYEHLMAVADAPMFPVFEGAPGRTILLGELIRNIGHPGRITQGLKGTCAATCVETYMAERDPGEYARLCAGLVSPSGRVKMKNGDDLVRDEEVLAPDEHEYRRSPVSRLFQAACMEYAYPDLDYHNVEDGQFEGLTNTGTGLSLGAFERLLGAMTAERWETLSDAHARLVALFTKFGVDTSKLPDLHRDAITIIERSAAVGETVFATLELPRVRSPVRRTVGAMEQAAHKIRVLGLDRARRNVIYDDPTDPQQSWFEGIRTQILDKYGRCTMSIADFERLLVELSYKPEFAPVHQAPVPAAPEARPV